MSAKRDFFKYYEEELFPKTLDETIMPFLQEGKADLIDFGYRITMNLSADFAGIDRIEKTPEETESLLSLVKTFSQGATLVHSKRSHDLVNKEVLKEKINIEDQLNSLISQETNRQLNNFSIIFEKEKK